MVCTPTARTATAAPAAPFVLPTAAALPVERVFVLKLAATPDGQPLQGRVEHLLSGGQADFGNLAELLDALARCQQPERAARPTVQP